MSLYSVVVPVYNSEHTLEELYHRLEKVFREILKEDFELILVDDGSKDRSYEVMEKLRSRDHRVKIIQMARNFGQHPALLCGFAHVKGDFVVTMDDDLQHQPEELPKMVRVMEERLDVDVIIASYEGRKHGPIRKLGTKVSVWATSKMLGKDPNLQITSYRLIRRFLVDAMLRTNTYLPQIGNLLVRVILLYSEQKQALAAELSFEHPAVLAVSGAAGSGKTALLAALLPVLKSRGLKVGVIREADDLRLPAETDRLHEAGAEGVAVFTAGRYLLTEQFRLNEQDLLALFERHGYDLVLLEGFGDSGWAKIEVVRSSVSPVGTAFQPMAIVGDVPGADFALDDPAALADWIENQMPSL